MRKCLWTLLFLAYAAPAAQFERRFPLGSIKHVATAADGAVVAAGTQQATGGASDIVLIKLDPKDGSIVASYSFGGPGDEQLRSVAIDRHGDIYIAGLADSRVFVAKLNSTLTRALYTANLEGSDVHGLAVDAEGQAYIATPGLLTKLNSTGSGFVYIAQLGDVTPRDLAVDEQGRVAVAAESKLLFVSANGQVSPTTLPGTAVAAAFDQHGGLYVAGQTPTATIWKFVESKLVYTFALHATGATSVEGLHLDTDGNPVVFGRTSATHFPTTADAPLRCLPQENAPYIAIVSAARHSLLYGTYLDIDPLPGPWLAPGFVAISKSSNETIIATQALQDKRMTRLTCVVNAAHHRVGAVTPATVILLYGSGIGPEEPLTASAKTGRYPNELGGVRVRVNGLAAPVLYASRNQVNAIVPFGAPDTGSLDILVEHRTVRTNTISVSARPLDPGVFRHGTTNSAVVVNEDGTLNDAKHPAPMGSVITFSITGAGRLASNNIDGVVHGAISTPLAARLTVSIGGVGVLESYSGTGLGMPGGVSLVTARVPRIADLRTPSHLPIDLAYLDSSWKATAYVWVK
jgi:uncharacterized protein (TIGR03437 family)